MGKVSRKEKKLAKQAIKHYDEGKKREQLLSQNPQQTYRRKIIYTKMSWPLQVWLMGRKDIVIFIILLIVLGIVAGTYIIYRLILWLIEVLPIG